MSEEKIVKMKGGAMQRNESNWRRKSRSVLYAPSQSYQLSDECLHAPELGVCPYRHHMIVIRSEKNPDSGNHFISFDIKVKGEMRGSIKVYYPEGKSFAEEEVKSLQVISERIGKTVERLELELYQVRSDIVIIASDIQQLTGITDHIAPNLKYLETRLDNVQKGVSLITKTMESQASTTGGWSWK